MDRQKAFSQDSHQVSPGGLEHGPMSRPASSQPLIAELKIEKIQPFLQIPDFTRPTISPHPIVVISPSSCTCIDGWDLLQSAKSAGSSAIACYAFYIPDHSDIEIAIRKIAIRTIPQGGTCCYAELVRNAGILFKMMMASTDKLGVFSHGGPRRGAGYSENAENDVRKLLANRLGKSVTTISKYLNHGGYLNAEAFNALIKVEADKEFFEAAQLCKRKIISDLKAAQKNEIEITAAVSAAILSVLQEYRVNKQAAGAANQSDQNKPSTSAHATSRDLTGRSSPKLQKLFQHWNGSNHAPEAHQMTENDVRRQIQGVGLELMKIGDQEALSARQMAEMVSAQTVRLAKLIQQLKHLDNLNTESTEDTNNG